MSSIQGIVVLVETRYIGKILSIALILLLIRLLCDEVRLHI